MKFSEVEYLNKLNTSLNVSFPLYEGFNYQVTTIEFMIKDQQSIN